MKAIDTALAGVKVFQPARHRDDRGYFCEWYNARVLAAAGLDRRFVQDNVVLSQRPGTIRGLHFQIPPRAQGKLIGVLRGSAFDVAVDIRSGSPSFGRHVAVKLTAELGNQVFIPEGFAHGICSLEADTIVAYKVTDYYDPACDKGIAWNDPDLSIAWPFSAREAHLSERDRKLPRLAELHAPAFRYEEAR